MSHIRCMRLLHWFSQFIWKKKKNYSYDWFYTKFGQGHFKTTAEPSYSITPRKTESLRETNQSQDPHGMTLSPPWRKFAQPPCFKELLMWFFFYAPSLLFYSVYVTGMEKAWKMNLAIKTFRLCTFENTRKKFNFWKLGCDSWRKD